MRKDIFLSITIDEVGNNILQQIADAETEGNRSQAIRYILREAAMKRGIQTDGRISPKDDKRGMR